MPSAVATVRGTTKQILYPFTRWVEFVTRVTQSANGSEQRFLVRPPLARFSLPYSNIQIGDVASQQAWFNAAVGKFAEQITLTLDAKIYNFLTLQQDTFESIIRETALYSTQVALRQTQNQAWTPPVAPTAYPVLSSGLSAMMPVTSGLRYITWTNDQETGQHYALSSYGGPFSNFPAAALPYWKLDYPVMTEVDLATIENFFLACQGRYQTFSFTDPITGIVYQNCRLDNDSLEIRYLGPRPGGHQVSTALTVTQTFIGS